jgi:hypothetical protein
MLKSVVIQLPEKNDAVTRIKKFMLPEDSGIVLNPDEEKMLDRFIFCKGLLCERKFTRDQIEEKLKIKFGVSIYTARKDVNNTYKVFASITNDYKKFSLQLQVEDISMEINRCKTDKSLIHLLPKFFAEKTRSIAAMPVDVEDSDLPAPVILINISGTMANKFIDASEARAEADALIEFEKKSEYIDYEDMNKHD